MLLTPPYPSFETKFDYQEYSEPMNLASQSAAVCRPLDIPRFVVLKGALALLDI